MSTLRWSALAATAILTLTTPGQAAGQVPNSVPQASAVQPRDSLLEQRVAEVAAGLRCPVCQNVSILDSPSELAQDMKRLVREKLAAGATPDEVRQYFVARYGDWVLLKPPAHGATLMVWVLPVAALLAGALVLWVAVRRWTRRPEASADAGDTEGTPAELRARRDALRQMLAELEEDFAEGKVTEQDYDTLRHRDETELAALNTALKEAKKGREPARPAPPPSGTLRRRKLQSIAGWVVGIAAFGAVAVLSLRGALAPRQPGGTMTGIAFDQGEESGGNQEEGGGGGGPMGISPADSARTVALEQRVARDSNDYSALLELGHLYMREQRLGPAAAVSMRAVRLRPQDRETGEAFAHLGMILWNTGELEGGLKSIDHALYLHPDLPEALLYKGIILFAGAHDPAAAAAAWERYLQVAPPGAETQRVRAMLQAARQSSQ